MSDPTVVPSRPNHLPLIISLCVNLLLAGVIAIPLVRFALHGPFFGRPMMHDAMGPSPERAQVHQMLSPRALLFAAPEKSDQIKAVLRSHHPRIAQLRTEAVAARRKVIEAFSAEKFDKAAFDKALSGMQVADAAFESEILKAVSESVNLLTPDERRKAMEFHPRPPMFGDRGRHWGRDRGEDAHDDGPQPPPPGGGQGPGGQPPRD